MFLHRISNTQEYKRGCEGMLRRWDRQEWMGGWQTQHYFTTLIWRDRLKLQIAFSTQFLTLIKNKKRKSAPAPDDTTSAFHDKSVDNGRLDVVVVAFCLESHVDNLLSGVESSHALILNLCCETSLSWMATNCVCASLSHECRCPQHFCCSLFLFV